MEVFHNQQERRIPHTKARKSAVQFDEVMGIPGEEYSKWKNDCSDIVRKRKVILSNKYCFVAYVL